MDLLSSRPFWPLRDGLPATFPALDDNLECDVAIIGGGITGAMVARQLTAAKFNVVVLERRDVAHGSTAGNTGLLLYELDVPMGRLAKQLGEEGSRRAYRRCRDAVCAVDDMVRASKLECGFAWRPNLYLAASRLHLGWLEREFEMRRDAGLSVRWWDRRKIKKESSLPHTGAIWTDEAAQLDAYRLTYGLLLAAQQKGARIFDRTKVTRWASDRGGFDIAVEGGAKVHARHLVIAAGYEAEAYLPKPMGFLRSTFALVTEPLEARPGWPGDGSMMWDTGDPYLFLRTTADGRVIIGGYDEPFRDAKARDRLLRAKTIALKRRLRQFFPKMSFEVATSWAGTFGTTRDGLPFIGQHPEVPNAWFALGFGGNGTTFSLIAADIIRGALLGEPDRDADLFGFDRVSLQR